MLLISSISGMQRRGDDEEPAAKSGDEQIEAYLKQETAKVKRARPRRGQDARRVGIRYCGCVRKYFDMLGLWPPCRRRRRSTPKVYWHIRERRSRHREAAFPESTGIVRHRQSVSTEKDNGQTAGDPLRLRPLRQRARRQQDRLPASRHVVRVQRLHLSRHRHLATRRNRGCSITARTSSAVGGGSRPPTPPPASSAGTAFAPSTISSAGPMWTLSASA